jgi:sugar lactone lactonase YvrE
MTTVADRFKMPDEDAIADPEGGRVLAGSWFYDPDQDYELGKLIRVDLDGTADVVDEGFHLANGLAFSPDAKTMYFADSAARRIYAYDYRRKILFPARHGASVYEGSGSALGAALRSPLPLKESVACTEER